MALDKRYLKWHGNQWIVVMKVPEKVRATIGKAHFKAPLHTPSLATANDLRWDHVTRFRKAIKAAESGAAKGPDPLVEEALAIRASEGQHGVDEAVVIEVAEQRAKEIEAKLGEGKASTFYAIATGQETPVTAYVDAWLAETPMKPRQKTDYRRAVTTLKGWLTKKTLEAVTRKEAGSYVSARVAQGGHWKTINKDVSALRSYWKWLLKKGHAELDVWMGQSLAKQQTSKKEEPRPFTPDEVGKLLEGKAKDFLKDAIRIAALSGMRVEEIAQLRVENIGPDGMEIVKAKTKAGERTVPIHSALASLIETRVKGAVNGWLFPELPEVAEDSVMERSQKIVKAFVTYRRALGIEDMVEGSRQSRVTFHSLRRFFVTEAERAGQPIPIIEFVVGHKREGMSAGRYSGGPSFQQRKACVEAVKLP